MTMLELRGVSKVYGDGAAQVRALYMVSLSVEPGTMVAVMGPSGSGKSTLLTIAGSLEEPTEGEVLVGGASLAEMSRNARAQLRRRSIGYVFQDFNLLAGLTAAENVALPLELDGMPARKARTAGLSALDELGLGDRAGHFPDQLSGGERQRVAIARAVVGDRRRGEVPPPGPAQVRQAAAERGQPERGQHPGEPGVGAAQRVLDPGQQALVPRRQAHAAILRVWAFPGPPEFR